jgi:hypothetical protein
MALDQLLLDKSYIQLDHSLIVNKTNLKPLPLLYSFQCVLFVLYPDMHQCAKSKTIAMHTRVWTGGVWNKSDCWSLNILDFFRNFPISRYKFMWQVALFYAIEMYNPSSNFTWSTMECISIEWYQISSMSELHASLNSTLSLKLATDSNGLKSRSFIPQNQTSLTSVGR